MSQATASPHKGRITARVPLHVQETIQRAAELTGVSVNAYIIQVMLQHAQESIERYNTHNIFLSKQDSEWFLEQLATPRPPNAKLKKAAARYRELVDETEDPSLFGSPEKPA